MGSPMGKSILTESTPGQPTCRDWEYTCAGEERLYRKTKTQQAMDNPDLSIISKTMVWDLNEGIEARSQGRENCEDPTYFLTLVSVLSTA